MDKGRGQRTAPRRAGTTRAPPSRGPPTSRQWPSSGRATPIRKQFPWDEALEDSTVIQQFRADSSLLAYVADRLPLSSHLARFEGILNARTTVNALMSLLLHFWHTEGRIEQAPFFVCCDEDLEEASHRTHLGQGSLRLLVRSNLEPAPPPPAAAAKSYRLSRDQKHREFPPLSAERCQFRSTRQKIGR